MRSYAWHASETVPTRSLEAVLVGIGRNRLQLNPARLSSFLFSPLPEWIGKFLPPHLDGIALPHLGDAQFGALLHSSQLLVKVQMAAVAKEKKIFAQIHFVCELCFLNQEAFQMGTHGLVILQWDYCNVLYMGYHQKPYGSYSWCKIQWHKQ